MGDVFGADDPVEACVFHLLPAEAEAGEAGVTRAKFCDD
jgi:hypothetical protein